MRPNDHFVRARGFLSPEFRRIALGLLLVAGVALRFYRLDRYPLGVHQDELSNMYDGYSIAETGADRFGDWHPAVVRAFGERDYRPALYAWLAAVPEGIAGFSIAAGRLPAAILGTMSLLLLFAYARNAAGTDYALAALLFGALSPLHIQFSRVAHEGGILPGFFLILALWLWQKNIARGFPVALVAALGLTIGLSANSYQATRLTGPLLVAAIAVDIYRRESPRLVRISTLAVAALFGAFPQILVMLREPARFVARAQVLSVHASGPFSYVATVVGHFFSNLDPRYLFIPGGLRGVTIARLNPAEIIFFYVGVLCLGFWQAQRAPRFKLQLYTALVVAIIPAAVTTDNPSTMRSSAIAVLTPLFSAAGLFIVGQLAARYGLKKRIYYPVMLAVVVAAFTLLTRAYTRSERLQGLSFQQIGVLMGRKAGTVESQYDAIFVQRFVTLPYIYIAAFAPISPRDFQRMPKELYSVGMDAFTRLGKYYFVWESTMPKVVETYRARPGRYLFIAPDRLAGLEVVDSVTSGPQKLLFQTSPR